MTSDLANLRGSGGPHSCTSQRKITSQRTVTPLELADNGDKPHRRETKMSQDNGTTILRRSIQYVANTNEQHIHSRI